MGGARFAAVIAVLFAMAACNSNEPQSAASQSDEVIYELAGTRWASMQLGEKPLLNAMEVTPGCRITGSQLELLNGQQRPVARFEARNL